MPCQVHNHISSDAIDACVCVCVWTNVNICWKTQRYSQLTPSKRKKREREKCFESIETCSTESRSNQSIARSYNTKTTKMPILNPMNPMNHWQFDTPARDVVYNRINQYVDLAGWVGSQEPTECSSKSFSSDVSLLIIFIAGQQSFIIFLYFNKFFFLLFHKFIFIPWSLLLHFQSAVRICPRNSKIIPWILFSSLQWPTDRRWEKRRIYVCERKTIVESLFVYRLPFISFHSFMVMAIHGYKYSIMNILPIHIRLLLCIDFEFFPCACVCVWKIKRNFGELFSRLFNTRIDNECLNWITKRKRRWRKKNHISEYIKCLGEICQLIFSVWSHDKCKISRANEWKRRWNEMFSHLK